MDRKATDINLKRRTALMVSICLIGIIILFRSYIVIQTDHSHIYNDYGCVVCLNVQSAEYVLRQLGMATKTILLLTFSLLISLVLFSENAVYSNCNSLIQLKVRMNN